jgi:haloalkane dehalogenase
MTAEIPDHRPRLSTSIPLSRRSILGVGMAVAARCLLPGPASAEQRRPSMDVAACMQVLRTPARRFADLDDYPFRPHYAAVHAGDHAGIRLRIHYLDVGPPAPARASGETVLLLHGEPSWSYLYRHVIPSLVAAGHRCIAPDLVGFGRSDKPAQRTDYTYQRHVDWLRQVIFERLELRGVTMVCHDWGGLLGLRLLAEHPRRFRRVVASNTYLPTGDEDLGEAFYRWRDLSQQLDPFDVGDIVDLGTVTTLSPRVKAAYDAPFPDESYKAGARQFPLLVPITPDDPAAEPNRRAWRVLETLHTPFLCAFSDQDFGVGGGSAPFRARIPGAQGQPHAVIQNAGHFLQEDRPAQYAQVINNFIHSTR